MLCGLQGTGKTTTAGKLAKYFQEKLHKKTMLAACDVYRPAAVKQLITLGEQTDTPVFYIEGCTDVIKIANDEGVYAGGICGYIYNPNDGGKQIISNCSSDAVITAAVSNANNDIGCIGEPDVPRTNIYFNNIAYFYKFNNYIFFTFYAF